MVSVDPDPETARKPDNATMAAAIDAQQPLAPAKAERSGPQRLQKRPWDDSGVKKGEKPVPEPGLQKKRMDPPGSASVKRGNQGTWGVTGLAEHKVVLAAPGNISVLKKGVKEPVSVPRGNSAVEVAAVTHPPT